MANRNSNRGGLDAVVMDGRRKQPWAFDFENRVVARPPAAPVFDLRVLTSPERGRLAGVWMDATGYPTILGPTTQKVLLDPKMNAAEMFGTHPPHKWNDRFGAYESPYMLVEPSKDVLEMSAKLGEDLDRRAARLSGANFANNGAIADGLALGLDVVVTTAADRDRVIAAVVDRIGPEGPTVLTLDDALLNATSHNHELLATHALATMVTSSNAQEWDESDAEFQLYALTSFMEDADMPLTSDAIRYGWTNAPDKGAMVREAVVTAGRSKTMRLERKVLTRREIDLAWKTLVRSEMTGEKGVALSNGGR